ncbi:MAG: peptidyl-alpha-hydroxyglycine alpha-amidating lyase family protein [Candidatus Bathyarchaeota archaeon]|nr:peptidyl-alpha-hydroxyglycine alpha-amidating lyase family protein [Candidatus Bathyarchaeota archaeon]
MRFGSDTLSFEVVEGWGKLPEGWSFGHVIGVAADSKDNVYVLNRGEHPVVIFDSEGEFKDSWGEGVFAAPHGIYIHKKIAYIADYRDHTVRKFTLDGELLRIWGTKDIAGEEGEPFNRPTDVAIAPSGEMYVSDGYGNSRVHKYSKEGEFILSWGEKGSGPGQFDLSHDVWVHTDGRVFVADRQNHRVQIFTPDGEYITEWTGFIQPCSVNIDKDKLVYVSELQARFSVLDIEGNLLARWGGEPSLDPGYFMNPHCAWIDSTGALYIGETLEGSRIQKFVRTK